MSRILLLLSVVAAPACSGSKTLTDGAELCRLDEVPADSVAELPADEDEVMALVEAERALQSTWSIAPSPDVATDVTVSLTRGPAAATVARRGAAVRSECEVGSFLRVPYEVEVRIGSDDAVGSGTVLVQATGSSPSDLILLSPGAPTFPGEFLAATLSNDWAELAEGEMRPEWVDQRWVMSLSGPYDAPVLAVLVHHTQSDATEGVRILWKGDLSDL